MEVYLVTGATSGIGKAVCEKLNGIENFIAIARNKKKFESFSKNNVYECDLNNLDEIKEIFDFCKFNRVVIKGLIHCAGLCPVQPVADISPKDMTDTYNVNVFSFIELCKQLKQYPLRCEDTRVIAISSITSDRAYQNQVLYASSKAALNSIVKSMAQLGTNCGIKVNAIEFGAVKTEMFDSLSPNMDTINRHYPLGVLEAEEAAEIICSFLGPAYKKMTGSIIRIDSGFSVVH